MKYIGIYSKAIAGKEIRLYLGRSCQMGRVARTDDQALMLALKA